MPSPSVTSGLVGLVGTPAAVVLVPLWTAVAMAAVLGAVLGSFLNVVVYRTPRGLSVVRPPSFCPTCGAPVRAFDNFPVVSWLILQGRCRSCRAPISARYPMVEAGTGILFALVTLAVGPHWAAAGLCILAAAIGVSAVIALDGDDPPASVPASGAAVGLAALVLAGVGEGHWAHVVGAVVGVAAAAAISVCAAVGAPRSGTRRTSRAWVLLPAGVLLGWVGPAGALVGVVALCSVLLLFGQRRRSWDRHSGHVGVATVNRVGTALAVSVAGVVAVLVALAAGATLS